MTNRFLHKSRKRRRRFRTSNLSASCRSAEIDAHFNAARVFVNTSEYEGFPNTFLQSWSRGIPTVSFIDTGSALNGERVVNVAADLDGMTGLVERFMQDDAIGVRLDRSCATATGVSHP